LITLRFSHGKAPQGLPLAIVTTCLQLAILWLEVITAESQACSEQSRQIRLPAPPGRVASLTTFESRWCGTDERPWLIEVPQGQRINITLMDFGLQSGQVGHHHRHHRHHLFARLQVNTAQN